MIGADATAICRDLRELARSASVCAEICAHHDARSLLAVMSADRALTVEHLAAMPARLVRLREMARRVDVAMVAAETLMGGGA